MCLKAEEKALFLQKLWLKISTSLLVPVKRKLFIFPWEHKKRDYISNNWDVVDPEYYSIGKFYSSPQQKLLNRIFSGLLTANGRKNYSIQMNDDADGFGDFLVPPLAIQLRVNLSGF